MTPTATLTKLLGTFAPFALLFASAACKGSVVPDADSAHASQGGAELTLAKLGTDPGHAGAGTPLTPHPGTALAAFAEGCFWGSEDTFRHVPGVVATAVGYSGGHTESPTYEDVCSHTTGHAETVLVEFDPAKVSYEQLVTTFWETHDPTTLNRQGPDVGDQYRSAIFTFSDEEDAAAHASMLKAQKSFSRPITTAIEPMKRFWKAEGYHQQYDEKSGRRSCPLPHKLKET